MTANEIRDLFLQFFQDKDHKIVPSAPIVAKNDPTLMFTNAGMNQFKDVFLGNQDPVHPRVADSQKCLRVSGKHNDLEEVGLDSYHHTMFEMLGNWSFGDYFKEEAIAWAWELLTKVYQLDADRLYATVFEGDEDDGLGPDQEAVKFWKKWLPEDRILYFDKKDNFWEMGDTGPCGPCSEIHMDLRPQAERDKKDGKELVNKDHPLVIEIWNLVFIQYNRKSDYSLESLPARHVDTGMGLERLCLAVQGKTSNYETDLFMPLIHYMEEVSGKKYRNSYDREAKTDIAMRVVVDHIRAVSFTIADGELPSNTGAGYVIRRILRRAVRYYYSFLDIKDPVLYRLVPHLADSFSAIFPELQAQRDFVSKVVLEEEKSFLRTLEGGLKRLKSLAKETKVIDGETAFELYDTYGFPFDLTKLIARENDLEVDEQGFHEAMQAQKQRSRSDAEKQVGDWTVLDDSTDTSFLGYDRLEIDDANIIKYREVSSKKGTRYQVVLDKTPFYAEAGGQVGDTGILEINGKAYRVLDTQRENELIVHLLGELPAQMDAQVHAVVDRKRRRLIENNHSATHLLHAALRKVLGDHVQQKGSLLNEEYLRFDFSHFQKVTDAELKEIESLVNRKIQEDIPVYEARQIPLEEAKEAGAMMLFGEKYGEKVRMITFDPEYSRELCGGCHVASTGQIGVFKITDETSVAAGVRRIEARTSESALAYINDELDKLDAMMELLKNPEDPVAQITTLQEENKSLRKKIDKLMNKQAASLKDDLIQQAEEIDGVHFVSTKVSVGDAKAIKSLIFQLGQELDHAVILLGAEINGKPQMSLLIDKKLVEEKGWNAGQIIRELATEIQGGGGGQPFFATAGGKNPAGIDKALEKGRKLIFEE